MRCWKHDNDKAHQREAAVCRDGLAIAARQKGEGMFQIMNKAEIDVFLGEIVKAGMTARAVKGAPTPGDTYSDGEPITRDVNVAWVCVETGDRCEIIYGPIAMGESKCDGCSESRCGRNGNCPPGRDIDAEDMVNVMATRELLNCGVYR